MFFTHFDSLVQQALFLKQVPTVKKAKIPSCDMRSTVKCWSENLPSPPWAFPLYQQDREEHPVGTMPFTLTRTLQSLFRHPGTTHSLVPKWMNTGEHSEGQAHFGRLCAASWIQEDDKQQTSQDTVRFAEECLYLQQETLPRKYHPPFLHLSLPLMPPVTWSYLHHPFHRLFLRG